MVFIAVRPLADVTSITLSLSAPTNGAARLTLAGEPWRSYRLEASEDLVRWTPVATLLCTNLLTDLVDADALLFPHRFYRAAQFVAAPSFESVSLTGDNQFQLILSGEAGRNYQLQTSTNLIFWTVLTNILMTNSSTPFVDPSVINFPQRFFRLVSP